jgi:peroxiredoxin
MTEADPPLEPPAVVEPPQPPAPLEPEGSWSETLPGEPAFPAPAAAGDPPLDGGEPAHDGEPVEDGEPAVTGSDDRLMTAGTIALAGVALAAGFLIGRQLLAPAPAAVPAAGTSLVAELNPEAVDPGAVEDPAEDESGLSVGLDWGEKATVGQAAPAISLQTPGGESLSLADFRGRPVVLNFFATWCGPCRVEMPHLEAASRRHAEDGLVVLGVDVQESAEVVQPFLDELGLSFPVVIDADGMVSDQYRIGILPTTYFIAPDGTIAREKVGFFTDEAMLAEELAYILPNVATAIP